jgi:hypothetical protein
MGLEDWIFEDTIAWERWRRLCWRDGKEAQSRCIGGLEIKPFENDWELRVRLQ